MESPLWVAWGSEPFAEGGGEMSGRRGRTQKRTLQTPVWLAGKPADQEQRGTGEGSGHPECWAPTRRRLPA